MQTALPDPCTSGADLDGWTPPVTFDAWGSSRPLRPRPPSGRCTPRTSERVAYETLQIWLDRPTTVDPLESAARVVGGRGGYCYHLNGAFSALATALGYQVTRHVGGVQLRGGEPGVTANHLVLTVRGLPEEANPGGAWLVDVGLGDALHEPLPLVAGSYEQGPFRYGLRPGHARRPACPDR